MPFCLLSTDEILHDLSLSSDFFLWSFLDYFYYRYTVFLFVFVLSVRFALSARLNCNRSFIRQSKSRDDGFKRSFLEQQF